MGSLATGSVSFRRNPVYSVTIIAGEHANRPAIRNDVMHAHEQHMLQRPKPDQHPPDQRAVCQIEVHIPGLLKHSLQCLLAGISHLFR